VLDSKDTDNPASCGEKLIVSSPIKAHKRWYNMCPLTVDLVNRWSRRRYHL